MSARLDAEVSAWWWWLERWKVTGLLQLRTGRVLSSPPFASTPDHNSFQTLAGHFPQPTIVICTLAHDALWAFKAAILPPPRNNPLS